MLTILRDKYNYRPQLVLTGVDKPVFNYSGYGNLAFIKQRTHEMFLKDEVIFAGFVSRDDLISLYRRAVALVFPSFFGPENIPPLEAFALDCPVITGDLAGSDEQYGDAALRLDPTQPELWAASVQKLREDPALRKALIARGHLRAGQFTADDFALGLFGIFDEFEAYRCNWRSDMTSIPPRL
jgi:glycosyltransferase involved in cell wall biosynthesis